MTPDLNAESQLCRDPGAQQGRRRNQLFPASDHSPGLLRAQERPGSGGTFSQAACPPRGQTPAGLAITLHLTMTQAVLYSVSLDRGRFPLPTSKEAEFRVKEGWGQGRLQNYDTVLFSVLWRLPGLESRLCVYYL